MEIKAVMDNVISLFLIILVGLYGVKRNIITGEIQKGLTRILMNITLPLLIITSFSLKFDESMKSNILRSFFYSFFCFIITGIISYILLLVIKDKSKRNVLQFANVFSNCGFVGFPIVSSIYGAEGVVYTAIFNVLFNLFLWTYGIVLYSDNFAIKDIRKVLFTPGIVAVYIGISILLFNVELPGTLYKSFKLVGDMTTPLSMIIIGCVLSKVNMKEAFRDITVYYGTFIRLIIIPLAIILFAKLVKDDSILINTIIVLQSMPAATMTSIIAESYNKESSYAAIIVFVTTLFSIVSFPIVLKIIS
ncbi:MULTISPECIES: AEC family transporter [Clostridium]|uniref:AEC family transporter n=1 Tax=Clostridium cibarium TaxID=2762247 RepID=A0ABR8PPH8_9CLOT|nr:MULTISPECIES: AEC family transporter [Clostridium]MBD7910073.1 AEC family transporter [Clostridium cibarium]